MTTEALTVADNWPEMSKHLAKTGFFDEDQLSPDPVMEKLINRLKRYTTVIGYLREGTPVPVGSGTFVRLADGQCGILTAGHVIRKIEDQGIVVVTQGIANIAWVGIEAHGMASVGKHNTGQMGPDLGWIPLSPQLARDLEDQDAVFYNRAKERATFSGPRCDFRTILGFVDEVSRPEQKELGFHAIFAGRTRTHTPDEDGWDYAEYDVDYVGPGCPSTHGGVSGAGTWRIELPENGKGEKEVTLEGVVFAEGDQDDRKLIAHGEASVLIFLDGIEGR